MPIPKNLLRQKVDVIGRRERSDGQPDDTELATGVKCHVTSTLKVSVGTEGDQRLLITTVWFRQHPDIIVGNRLVLPGGETVEIYSATTKYDPNGRTPSYIEAVCW